MDMVLIVEDDLLFQRLLMIRLQEYKDKFGIILANNGEEAIKILEQRQISFVVTDLEMPKIDGLTLLTYLNKNHPQIPFVVITAHGEKPEIVERFSKADFRILHKPFMIDELAQIIIQDLESESPGGSLTGISVVSFLQLIEMEGKTCFLEIISAEGEKGIVYFKEGKLYDAIYCGLKGEEAASELIAMDNASIRLNNFTDKKMVKRINTSLMNLILDAMARKDETESAGTYKQ